MWQRFIGNQLTEAVIRICQTFDRIIGQTDKLLPFINQQKTNVHILVSRNHPFLYIGHSMAIIKVRLFNVYICLVCSFARNQFHFIISKKVTVANFFVAKSQMQWTAFFLFRWTKCWDSLLANVSRIFDFYHVYIATDCINKSITFSYIIHEIAYQKCFHPRYCSLSTNEIVTFYRWHAAWKTPTTHCNG